MMEEWHKAINYWAGIIVVGFIISSFWWDLGFLVAIAVGSVTCFVNILIEDLYKERRLKKLEEELATYKGVKKK